MTLQQLLKQQQKKKKNALFDLLILSTAEYLVAAISVAILSSVVFVYHKNSLQGPSKPLKYLYLYLKKVLVSICSLLSTFIVSVNICGSNICGWPINTLPLLFFDQYFYLRDIAMFPSFLSIFQKILAHFVNIIM